MKRALLFIIAPLLLTYSCSKVNSNDLKDDVPYYQSYEVSFDKTLASTSAMASYKIRDANGARVDLANGAGVSANNIGPSTDFLDKTLYKWNFTGNHDVNFVLTKNSGAKINNTVSLNDLGKTDFATGFPTSASKASGLTFTWMGDAVSATETLNISISTTDSGSYVMKSLTQTNSAFTVTFSAADMVNVKPGLLTVVLSRNKTMGLDNADGTASGAITVRSSARRTLTLNP
ncbi:MAG: hypothetical protein JST82_14920 [Bacteroidetes bacterium]|nr:hypothetical protein [Bacteroidota bacterium]